MHSMGPRPLRVADARWADDRLAQASNSPFNLLRNLPRWLARFIVRPGYFGVVAGTMAGDSHNGRLAAPSSCSSSLSLLYLVEFLRL